MTKNKLIGTSLVALSLMGLLAFVLPLYQGIGEYRSAIRSQKEKIDQKEKFLAKVSDFKKKLDDKKNGLDKLDGLLTKKKDIQDVIVTLETITRESGVFVSSLKTSVANKEGTKDSTELLQIEMSVSGQYSALENFLRSLEKNLRIFDVQAIDIVEKEGLLNMDLKFNTYFLK